MISRHDCVRASIDSNAKKMLSVAAYLLDSPAGGTFPEVTRNEHVGIEYDTSSHESADSGE